MRRPGTRATYDRLLSRIRARVPGVTLRTTFIVGFPGETEDEFAELERFVADTAFDHVGVFTYSHEEGTRAFALPDDIPAATKRRRRRALMARQKRLVGRAQQQLVGRDVRVLVDGPSVEHELVLQGRLEGQAPDIDPVVCRNGGEPPPRGGGGRKEERGGGARGEDQKAAPGRTAGCP